ncbi:MAG: type I DNA topoisomerase, partial [Gammaproteobacteria bacterium]
MGKSLVIVESPAKAKTINKYLGNQYVVKSSIGHIRDLPTSGSANKEPVKRGKAAAAEAPALSPKEKAKRQLITRMGVDPEHGWKAKYEILPGKEKVIEELRRLAKEADTIYLATDLDREGEAIAWHLRESIGGDDSRYKRVVFNEITKKAIQEAFSQPGELDLNRVNAQQARRFLDRVVGYMVSPLLWAKIARGLSAGRVQSVAVKLVVEREREIRAFVPEEYWEVHADLATAQQAKVRFEVAREKGEAFKPLNEAQANAALEKLQGASYSVAKREDKPTSSKPSAPFITSTLQQAASNRLGFGVKKTMMMAQRLYEAGYITYMRTDSTNLSADAISMVRGFIEGEFGDKYLPEKPNLYSSKEGAQEAHEAIRPTSFFTRRAGSGDEARLYELVYNRALASQMASARLERTSVDLTDGTGRARLRASGQAVIFPGFLALYEEGRDEKAEDEESKRIPVLREGDSPARTRVEASQHFTQPPPRYSEASLVKRMEELGIGRPSTYASILQTLKDRDYVRVEKGRFVPEESGRLVTAFLERFFEKYVSYDYTAELEEELDDVSGGRLEWHKLLEDFWRDFRPRAGEVMEQKPSEITAAIDDFLEPWLYPPRSDG